MTTRKFRFAMALVLSIIMLGIGIAVLGRVLVLRRPPLTNSMALDSLFGAFFLIRGYMHFRTWKQLEAVAATTEDVPPTQ